MWPQSKCLACIDSHARSRAVRTRAAQPPAEAATAQLSVLELDDLRQERLSQAKIVADRDRARATAQGARFGMGLWGKIKNVFLGSAPAQVVYVSEPAPAAPPGIFSDR